MKCKYENDMKLNWIEMKRYEYEYDNTMEMNWSYDMK